MGSRKKSILIVGDWLVSDHLFLVPANVDNSSYVEKTRYKTTSEEAGNKFRYIGGAGRIARKLVDEKHREGSSKKDSHCYKIYGLGNWHKDDQELFLHLLHDCSFKTREFRLKQGVCPKKKKALENELGIRLFRLDKEATTKRVIRLHDKNKIISRIDLEYTQTVYHQENSEPDISEIKNLPKRIDHIIVNDLCDGVVTIPLLSSLHEKYRHNKSLEWYVKSNRKLDDSNWNDFFSKKIKNQLKLKFVSSESAIDNNPFDIWLTENDKLSRKGYELLKNERDLNEKDQSAIVLLSSENKILAKSGNRFLVGTLNKEEPFPPLGRHSRVFTTIAHAIMSGKNDLESINKGLEDWNPKVKESGWGDMDKDWAAAMNPKGFGIISNKPPADKVATGRLEVWRASTDLFGYVACSEEKRKAIQKIGGEFRSFQNNKGPERKRKLSILLTADPGAGKTALVKALKSNLGFEYLPYNITQISSRKGLLDIFAEINARQANNPETNILVFIDEINAKVEGEHPYSTFLVPLEDGTYIYHGRTSTIKPCVWIFAGTNEDSTGENKEADFRSRLILEVSLSHKKLEEQAGKRGDERRSQFVREAQLEQVYLSAIMMKNIYPEVRYVTKEVFEKFYNLPPDESPARKMRKYISKLHSVRHGSITSDNWRESEWEECFGSDEDKGKRKSSKYIIELLFE